MDQDAEHIVERFWELMATNDFAAVGGVLADDFELLWPQSAELIRGRDNFATVNNDYPAHGRWQFMINRLFGRGGDVVSDVSVSDGVVRARAISFFTVANGRITRIVEFWPDAFTAADNRRHLVEIVP